MHDELFAFRTTDTASQPASGPLAGIRVALQPDVQVRSWPCDAGSAALRGFRAFEDATAVQRLRSGGAAIVGLLSMNEMGLGLAGDGTARALSAGLCDAALVNDWLGQGRHIAAAAGQFAFKPSYGICSRNGLIGLCPSLESISVAALSLDTLAALMQALCGPDECDMSMLRERSPDFTVAGVARTGMRFGVIAEMLEALDADEREAFQQVLQERVSKYAAITVLSLPDWSLSGAVHQVIGSVEASSSAGRYDSVRYGQRAPGAENWNEMYISSRAQSFGPLLKAYLFQGAYFQFKDYPAFEHACRLRRALVQRCEGLFADVDALVLPVRSMRSSAESCNTVADMYRAFGQTLPANLTGAPAVVLPGCAVGSGGELGLQLTGRHGDDVRLLDCARMLSADCTKDRHHAV